MAGRLFLSQASVRTILSAAVAALSAAALLGVFVITGVAYRVNAQVDAVADDTHTDEMIGLEAVNAVQQQMLVAMQYVNGPRPDLREAFDRIGEAAYGDVRQYLQRSLTVPERRQVERIKERHEIFEVAAQDAFSLADSGRSADARAQVRELTAYAAELQDELNGFMNGRRARRAEFQAHRSDLLRWLLAAGVLLAFLLFLLSTWIRHALIKRLEQPLRRLAAAVREVGHANLDVSVPVQDGGEISELSRDFNAMAQRLRAARESADYSLQRYTNLVESMHAVVWEAPAASYACTFVSSYAETVFGYPVEEWIGDAAIWRRIIHPDDFDQVFRECVAATAARQNHTLEYRAVTRDGRILWVRDVVAVSADEQDDITLHGVIFDVTAEREAQIAVRQSEERFRALIEHSSDTVTVVDANGTTMYAGPASVLGYAPEARVGRTIMELIHPDDLPKALSALAFTRDGAQETTALELRARHVKGDYRWLEVKARNLLDHPAVRGIVINSRDVHDRKIAEVELETTQHNLRQAQKMEAVGQLAGGIAHDFNNLLTAIRGNAQLLQEGSQSGGDELSEITRAADRAAQLTAQLLAFSRKQLQNPEVLDLNVVVEDMQRLCRRVIGEHITIEFKAGRDDMTVRADKSQLEQVILNLVVNARDAMPDGGSLRIAVERTALKHRGQAPAFISLGDYVVLRVADDGVGMDEQTMARIFDPFFTTKDVGRGTGLGLSTVYGIVKQSHGYIDVESTVGVGSVFRVWLPFVNHAPAARSPESAPAELDGKERVLIVEDETSVRQLAQRMLARKGYRVATAENGVDAIELLRTDSFDAVIADMIMPLMGGAELAARMASENPDIPVVLVSGYSEEEVFQRAKQGNPNVRFLGKPYTAETLLLHLREALRSKTGQPAT